MFLTQIGIGKLCLAKIWKGSVVPAQYLKVKKTSSANAKAEPWMHQTATVSSVPQAKVRPANNFDKLRIEFTRSYLERDIPALGLRLRGWRHDEYRTRMKDEQKRTLATVTVISAPDGAEQAWADAAAVAAHYGSISIVTFVTLGYGDISQTSSPLQLLSAIEAFSGMFLTGLFLAGFASKTKQY